MVHLDLIQVVLLCLQYILINCNNDCITTQDSPGNHKGRPCVFPFIIEQKNSEFNYTITTYDECTTDFDPDDRLWCSTETDEFNVIIVGKWGYCSDGCMEKEYVNLICIFFLSKNDF